MFMHPRHKDASELDNRLDWWLREYGRTPSRAQLRRIRAHKRAERRSDSLATPSAKAMGAVGPREPAAPLGGPR